VRHYSGGEIEATVGLEQAVERVAAAFVAFSRGEWEMPPKVYVAGEGGDFRAMPARGAGHAVLKWVTSFPDNPARGLPTVSGIVLLSDARDGTLLALLDAAAITYLRTAAAAAVAARTLARPDATSVGVVGAGVNGGWTARAMALDDRYTTRLIADRDPMRAEAAAQRAEGFRVAGLEDVLACDVVCTVTPGASIVAERRHLRPGQHWNLLGADAAGKAEMAEDALRAARLFCDDLAQAGHSGDIARLHPAREDVTDIGTVLGGSAEGRRDADEVTVFDSTGLAVQDLALALAVVGVPA
jgi:ornithine cyclodeaminase/alanine dehydrogenase-like protein (mu-crystallin family)